MLTAQDRQIVRDLARRVAEIAALPIQQERRRRWKLHNSLKSCEPMLLVFPEGAWRELLPEQSLRCEGEKARGIELSLRRSLYYHDHFADDSVISADWNVGKAIGNSGWGLDPKRIPSTEKHGAWQFDPVLREFSDLNKLRAPQISYDEKKTQQSLTDAQELFGDILNVRLRGVCHISYHLMQQYSYLRGLEQMLFDLSEEPKLVHEFLEFVTTAHQNVLRQYQSLNLLDLNNDNSYQNSGGNGWTDELPVAGCDRERVRPCDMWASAEVQEFAVVSPAMHEEFAMQYERRLLAPFGLTGYGCCEDLTLKLSGVTRLPQMRRISICPWANVEKCAAALQDRFIFSWKPNPSTLVGFDEDAVRQYVRRTLELTGECVLEIVLKDTHTCENQPERMHRWIEIAREEISEHMACAAR